MKIKNIKIETLEYANFYKLSYFQAFKQREQSSRALQLSQVVIFPGNWKEIKYGRNKTC